VLVLDAEGNLEFGSPLACDLLGCNGADDLKSRWETIKSQLPIDPEHLPDTSEPARFRVDLVAGTTGRSLHLEIHAIDIRSRAGCVVLLKDRLALDGLESELLLASRMRTQSRLLGALMHELKAPLNAMEITLDLLAGALDDGVAEASAEDGAAHHRRYLRVLREETQRLNRGLVSALDPCRPLSPTAQGFDLRELMREIAHLLEPQARHRRVTLQVQLPEGAAPVLGFRDRIKQAVLNIAVNRLEAMPGGGRLALSLGVDDKEITAIIGDGGSPVSVELEAETFQIHLTSNNSAAGIDLNVARRILESHGGALLLERKPGMETCFRLMLPRAPAASS
jgi:signal transduction histidine kinase